MKASHEQKLQNSRHGPCIVEKKMEATIVYWGYMGIMEKKMEATIVYWGYMGIMEKKMEATIVYWGYIDDNGKENGSYYSILGLYRG